MDTKQCGLEFVEAADYEELSRISAERMIECVRNKPDALLCVATGSSPLRAYELFVEYVRKEQIDVQNLHILKLDEWWKVDKRDPSTCECFIQDKLLEPLKLSPQNYIAFDSNAVDAELECIRISRLLREVGPIDLCILGLGKNGHLGLNEPGDFVKPYAHAVELTEKTKTHAMLKRTDKSIEQGMTLGMAELLGAKKVLFLVSGDGKSETFKAFLEMRVTSLVPASFLWLHSSATCVFESRVLIGTELEKG